MKIAMYGSCFAALSLIGAGCYWSAPAPKSAPSPTPKARKIQINESSVGGSAYLVRRKGDNDAMPAEMFWDRLLPSLAEDAESRALLQRLFGGLRVQLVILDTMPGGNDPVWKEKPGAGFDAVLRLTNRGARELQTTQAYTKAAKQVPIEFLVGSMSLGVVIDADPPKDIERTAGSSTFLPPNTRTAVKLLLEDWLLRHKSSWRGVHLGSFGEQEVFNHVAETANQSPDELRQDLDARIAAFEKEYRSYLGSIR